MASCACGRDSWMISTSVNCRTPARACRSRYGELVRLEAGERSGAASRPSRNCRAGRMWWLPRQSGFALVPAGSGLNRSLSKSVALSVGRARSFNPAQPMSIQLALRYRELTLGRGLRR